MIVYCNGDSFTAGSELADNLFPYWPGYSPEITTDSDKTKFLKHKDLLKEKFVDMSCIDMSSIQSLPTLYDKKELSYYQNVEAAMQMIEKYRAWPNQLSLIDPSISTINESRGGAGIVGICQRTIADLIKLRRQNKKVDLVILQMTSVSRLEIYDKTVHELMYERPVVLDHWLRENDIDIAKATLKKYTTDDYTIKYIYNLASTVEAIKSLTGRYPLLIDSINREHILGFIDTLRHHFISIKDNEELERLESLIEGSRINHILSDTMKSVSENIKNPYCVLGHFSTEVHKKFAEVIYENINSRR